MLHKPSASGAFNVNRENSKIKVLVITTGNEKLGIARQVVSTINNTSNYSISVHDIVVKHRQVDHHTSAYKKGAHWFNQEGLS